MPRDADAGFDVTDRDRDALHLRATIEAAPFGVLTADAKGRVMLVNERFRAILGTGPVVLRGGQDGGSLDDLLDTCCALPEVDRQRLRARVRVAFGAGGVAPGELDLPCDGVSHTLSIARLADGCALLSIRPAAAPRAADAASALELAMSDPLTGLPNRARYLDRLTHALAVTRCRSQPMARPPRAVASPPASPAVGQAFPPAREIARMFAATDTQSCGQLAVMMIDLDRFKLVNDTLGHAVGDSLLRLVAKRLRTILPLQDLVARLGGDEFAVIVTQAGRRGDLALLAARIVDVLGRPYLVDGHLVNIGASLGIAISPRHGRTPQALMRCADLALYDAKRRGRNAISFFRPDMSARALARRSLELDLRGACSLDQFELHFQPQIDLGTDRIEGFEALIRWRHPERGLVAPGEFIPLAEEIGLIGEIGEWVMNESCRIAMRWPSHMAIAVNVSVNQFENPGALVAMVADALRRSGLPGHRLEVEVTENALLRNEAAVLSCLARLRSLGVRIAMDNFGTGYSSFNQLYSFPFDKIKIDRSFVGGSTNIARRNAIVRAIAGLGMSLGISTIAEGVETQEQLDRIRSEGCNSVQGFLFSRPVPAEQIDRLIAATERGALAFPKAAAILEMTP